MLTRLLAPFRPFVSETVHAALVASVWPDLPDSVHLRPGRPCTDGGLFDPVLADQVALVRRLVDSAAPDREGPDPGSRWATPWSAPRAGPRCRRSCGAQVADELKYRSRPSAGPAASWSTSA